MINTLSRKRLEEIIVAPELKISEAIARLDAAGIGALAVCGNEGKLCGILTDGDLRRAVLKAVPLDAACLSIATKKPIVTSTSASRTSALRLMNLHDIDHLPMLDERGTLQELLLRRDLTEAESLDDEGAELLTAASIHPSATIAEAIERLDRAGTGALVLCESDRTLRGLLTDGDIRRAILRGVALTSRCDLIASSKPLTVSAPFSAREVLALMSQHDVNQLPVIDAEGRVTRLLLRRDLTRGGSTTLSAIIMAGGYGKRLLPLTERVPKPMLPVGDTPLLELTIQQLRRSGIRDISLTTHYLPERITEHFGDGSAFGVRLTYLREDFPLGTAGGLKLAKRTNGPFLVINGDILTGLPFHEMLNFHRKHGAVLTVGVRKYEVEVPFGVVECDNLRVLRVREKPALNFFINAGMYLLEPSACDFIPDQKRFDMTDLIQELITAGKTVLSFPIVEYWLDVGRPGDYQRAQEDVMNGRIG